MLKMEKIIIEKFNLSNKVIIITGALGLLGKKHVEVVAENGGIPIIIDTNKNVVSLAKNISENIMCPLWV